jgi:hypothetical protein
LFLKFIPAVAVAEVKELRHELAHGHYFPHPALVKSGSAAAEGV